MSSVISINDPNVFFSPCNWWFDSSQSQWAQSLMPGAYVKVGFTGTSFQPIFNYANIPDTTHQLTLDIWVDNRYHANVNYKQAGPTVAGADTITALPSGNHMALIVCYGEPYDRWNAYSGGAISNPNGNYYSFYLTGFNVDTGATSAPLYPGLHPKRALFFGDSITEGVNNAYYNGISQSIGGAYCINWAWFVAKALDAEHGQLGVSGIGYEVAGQGNVPKFTTSWNMQNANVARSFTPAPDYVVVHMGTNDYFRNIPSATLQADVKSMLQNIRTACPTAWIFQIAPDGGQGGTANAAVTQYARPDITAGFNAYQAATPDPKAVLIASPTYMGVGLHTGGAGNLYNGYGDVHPCGAAQLRMAAYHSGQIFSALAPRRRPIGGSFIG